MMMMMMMMMIMIMMMMMMSVNTLEMYKVLIEGVHRMKP